MASRKLSEKHWLVWGAIGAAFVAGVFIPSPLFYSYARFGDGDVYLVRDTTEMILPDGSVYEGTVNARTGKFDGYGALKRAGTSYVGKWKNGRLVFGKMSAGGMVYEGLFDAELHCHGFGIAHYLPAHVDSLRTEGLTDHQIITTYIGNFDNNVREGLGRAVMADSTLEFGEFHRGMLVQEPGTDFHTGDRVYGIDLSHFQQEIDWDQLALFCDSLGQVFYEQSEGRSYLQPVLFAYIKATEGASYRDQTFTRKMIQAKRHGIVRGAYHFLRLGTPITAQVENFTRVVRWLPGDLPPTLDVELEDEILALGAERFRDSTYRWLKEVEATLGVKPLIYTTDRIRNLYLKQDVRFDQFNYWMARYDHHTPTNTDWTFWQFSPKGKINGIDSLVDLDIYHNNYAAFSRYLRELAR